jgi:hypothetical protein
MLDITNIGYLSLLPFARDATSPANHPSHLPVTAARLSEDSKEDERRLLSVVEALSNASSL